MNKIKYEKGFGILTMAFHKEKYLKQAITLARSIRLHNPTVKVAIVTNLESKQLSGNFDQIIEYRPEYGDIFEQKLYLYEYSPFKRTLYIDSDCIVFGSVSEIKSYLSEHSFWMPGENLSKDYNPYWGIEAADWCQRLNTKTIPRFNAGVFYYEKSETAKAVFKKARRALDTYDTWGIRYVSGGKKTDEPCFSLGMVGAEVIADPEGSTITSILNDFTGAIFADVISGSNLCFNAGKSQKVSILHFAGMWQKEPTYKRESFKLELINMGLSTGLIYFFDAILYLWWGAQAELARKTRKLLGKEPFPLSPLKLREQT